MGKFFIQFINTKVQRVIIYVASLSFLAWWPYFQISDSSHIDPLWMRLSLALPSLFAAVASNYFEFFSKHLRNFFYGIMILAITHSGYLVYVNKIDAAYMVGAVVLLFGLASVIESPRFKTFILSYFLLVVLIVCLFTDGFNLLSPKTKSSLYIMSAVTVVLVSIVTQYLQLKMNALLEKEISENNNLRKWSSLGQMAGGVAHEINSPLTSIYFAADNLQEMANENKLSAEFILEIDKIRTDAERISSIMKALRLLTKEGTKFEREEVHLHKICLDIIDLNRALAEKKNTQLTFKTSLLNRPIVLGNEQSLAQVLVNLVKNAIEAIQLRDDKWVSLTLTEDDDHFLILVQDSGYGIPKEVQDRVFEPFYSTKDIGGGMGIGLSLSRQIAIAHGGDLTVDNSYKNTTFKLAIPKNTIELSVTSEKKAS